MLLGGVVLSPSLHASKKRAVFSSNSPASCLKQFVRQAVSEPIMVQTGFAMSLALSALEALGQHRFIRAPSITLAWNHLRTVGNCGGTLGKCDAYEDLKALAKLSFATAPHFFCASSWPARRSHLSWVGAKVAARTDRDQTRGHLNRAVLGPTRSYKQLASTHGFFATKHLEATHGWRPCVDDMAAALLLVGTVELVESGVCLPV
ncbi:unnamed protein product [Symbiodinium natans]|uniref:Uncharacterized protein n=1 Tax=Symbiodinium natans TaxID=878477 RepID=A0A812K630_9DINO|nr:unnamed protein product [Symbiodinium natans]